MFEKEYVQTQNQILIDIRNDFYDYLDQNTPKNSDGTFDFSKNTTLEASKVYEQFFKLDYQARKLRGILVQTYGLDAN